MRPIIDSFCWFFRFYTLIACLITFQFQLLLFIGSVRWENFDYPYFVGWVAWGNRGSLSETWISFSVLIQKIGIIWVNLEQETPKADKGWYSGHRYT